MSKYSFQHTITPRPNTNDDLLIDVLDGLLSRYLDRVPDAGRVVDLFTSRGDQIINDHIAFRSIHLESILRIFLHLGFEVRMDPSTGRPFNFEAKKLTAVWLKHPNPAVPRVFVSQFRFEEGSPKLQAIVNRYMADWQDPIKSLDLNDATAINTYLHTAQWPTPTHADYTALQQESEYVSWVLYNKYYLNHFTLSVHELDSFNFTAELDIVLKNYTESYKKQQSDSVLQDACRMMKRKYKKQFFEFNDVLKSEGFTMNPVGDGVMNISPDECLLQSSTKSNIISAPFDDGHHNIPGSYVEFAYRGCPDDVVINAVRYGHVMADIDASQRRDGFETQNADKIFESTYVGAQEDSSKGVSAYEASCQRLSHFLESLN